MDIRGRGRQYDNKKPFIGPLPRPFRVTRARTKMAESFSRGYQTPSQISQYNRYGLALPIPKESDALWKKRGYMVYESETGKRLTWDFVKYLGQDIIKNHAYYYIVSCDLPGIDDVDGEGKVKLGYSAAKGNNNGFATRLEHYQTIWGNSAKLHMLIIFNNERKQALDYETEVKRRVKQTLELGSNVRFHEIIQYNRQHEFFRLRELGNIMRQTKELYNKQSMGEFYVPPEGTY